MPSSFLAMGALAILCGIFLSILPLSAQTQNALEGVRRKVCKSSDPRRLALLGAMAKFWKRGAKENSPVAPGAQNRDDFPKA